LFELRSIVLTNFTTGLSSALSEANSNCLTSLNFFDNPTYVEKRTALDRAKAGGLRGDRDHARSLVPSLEEALEGHARTKLGLYLEP
jgi:hypothetical protein